jgi:peptidoglycan/xylan/chitin deacetylase (PgdA/CDA1 family)
MLGRLLLAVFLLDAASAAAKRVVAVTVDDLPGVGPLSSRRRSFSDNLRRIVRHLRKARAPAWGFVCAGRGGLKAIRVWANAGLPLGNHTFTHQPYSKLSVAAYLDDVKRNEDVLRTELGVELRGGYFRYPFLDHGHTEEKVSAMVAYLAAHKYGHAPVSLDTVDYRFARIYATARRRNLVAAMYVAHVRESAEHFERMSRSLYGREIPLVLLVHANELNADRLGAVLVMLRRRGYRFARLEEVLADEAYAQYGLRPPLLPLQGDRNFLNQVALSRGLHFPDPSGDGYFEEHWLPKLRRAMGRGH